MKNNILNIAIILAFDSCWSKKDLNLFIYVGFEVFNFVKKMRTTIF